MPATTTATSPTMAASPCSSSPAPPASPLSVRRPALSPRKRKLSDASEAASPTSMDEVASAACCSSSNSNSSNAAPLEERVISPKKKARAEGPADSSKWESHVVASFAATALDLDDAEPEKQTADPCEPIAFWAAPAGDLTADELEILRHFLA